MPVMLAVDFGSTFTKVAAIDLDAAAVVGLSHAPTTVDTDVNTGLRNALDQLRIDGRPLDHQPLKDTLACSSAAGGLKVVVIGLVPDLTVEAARRAAFGAGAKIVGSYAYKLNEIDVRAVENIGCDMVLLAGGTDGGDEKTILHNASMLASSSLTAPIVVAGNHVVSSRGQALLKEQGKVALVAENILPTLDTLNILPVQQVIRNLFMNHIIHAKGIDRAQEYVRGGIIPTPSAVLKAAQLLAEGTPDEPGLGEVVVVDVGGATTDVHSVCTGTPTRSGVILKGLPEPYVKRTVEGDLGLRANALTLLERAGQPRLRASALALKPDFQGDVQSFVERVAGSPSTVPNSEDENVMDAALGKLAVEMAMERHAGRLEELCTAIGPVYIQHGKDLSGISTVIGVGGVLAYGKHPRWVLGGVCSTTQDPFSLRPADPAYYVDTQYIMYAVGLLGDVEPTTALRVAKRSLQALQRR
jgi:uncharacterized protein (TIGR01319 family)